MELEKDIERFNSEEWEQSLTSATKCSWESRSDRMTSTTQFPTEELLTMQHPTEELRATQQNTLTSYDAMCATLRLTEHISIVRM